MSSPKEKAEELVLKMLRINNDTQEWFHKGLAKQCALIAVDEVIKALNPRKSDYMYRKEVDFYKEVKQEIEKL